MSLEFKSNLKVLFMMMMTKRPADGTRALELYQTIPELLLVMYCIVALRMRCCVMEIARHHDAKEQVIQQ